MAKLYFYYSAMNAGKSTMLLQSNHNYHERGMRTLLFTPSIDTRYTPGKICSRIGLEADAVVFNDEFDLFSYAAMHVMELTDGVQCVLVDEAQFLTKAQVMQLSEIVDELSIPVLTYGIRSDFRGELFEGSQYLLAWADELIEIKTVCHCGRKAIMNLRLDAMGKPVDVGQQIQIGGNETYLSVCRQHYKGEGAIVA